MLQLFFKIREYLCCIVHQYRLPMKNLFVLFILLTLGAFSLRAQAGAEVPASVKQQLATRFPDVKKAKWKVEDQMFEAEFKRNGVQMSALFDATGNLLEQESEISKKQLPAAVTSYVAAKYAGYKIEEASRLERDGKIFYELEIEAKESDLELLFDSAGNFVSEVKEADDDE